MPSPLSPSSSQEIVNISPPPTLASSSRAGLPLSKGNRASSSKGSRASPSKGSLASSSKGSRASSSNAQPSDRDGGTTLPRPAGWEPPAELKGKMVRAARAYDERVEVQSGKRKVGQRENERARKRAAGAGRARQTEIMMNTLGKGVNPITNSDLYTRSDHFVSCATGHQQSNRGGGSSGAATYWEVRNAKMAEQAREKTTELFKGCVFYINGSTGPRLSNLQLQHVITSNGGRFTRSTQNGSNTHIIANGGLSGTKTQKHIDGQGGRGASRRAKVLRVEWILDSVERGIRLSEAGYGIIKDPTQDSLFVAWGVKPKAEVETRNEPEVKNKVEVDFETKGKAEPGASR